MAYTLESLPKEKYLGMLLTPGGRAFFGRCDLRCGPIVWSAILERSAVDWGAIGFAGDALTSIAEHMLRIAQSFILSIRAGPRDGPWSYETTCGIG